MSKKLISTVFYSVFALCFVIMLAIMVKGLLDQKADNEAYAFSELRLVDSEMKKEYVQTGSGDDRRTETRISYFLIEENGNKIEVNQLFYDRFIGPGVYYAGRTASGNVFSFYPGEYFEPAWE